MAFSFFKKSEKPKKEETHAGPRYFDLRIKNIVQETKDAISIVFDHPAEGKIKYIGMLCQAAWDWKRIDVELAARQFETGNVLKNNGTLRSIYHRV